MPFPWHLHELDPVTVPDAFDWLILVSARRHPLRMIASTRVPAMIERCTATGSWLAVLGTEENQAAMAR